MNDTEKARLLDALQSQRDHVVGILAGLDEEAARRAVAPSGWSIRDLLHHLTHDDERFWFSCVVAGDRVAIEETTAAGDHWHAPVDASLAELVATYVLETERSSAVLAAADLDAKPAWWPDGFFGEWRLDEVRQVVLHLITETATHAGHLDLVRELIDRRQWIVLTD